MAKILLIEDDARVASFISKGLTESLHQVTAANTGKEGIVTAMQEAFDMIILDVMLPDMDGFEICAWLRKRKNTTPVLILSALDTPEEKVKGLQLGADDYLAKPFLFDELLARIDAQMRRVAYSKGATENEDYAYAGVLLNMAEQSASRDNKPLDLSPREFRLLVFLMKNRERALSRVAIAQAVWNIHFDHTSNTVDVYINYLRKKLDKGFAQPLIHTVKGTGYMLKQKYDEPET